MIVTPQSLAGVLLISPDVFQDERGFFMESYHQEKFSQAGVTIPFVQDNYSQSQRGTIRGLHFQTPPYGQAKLVRVARGAIYDVVVDIRKESPAYGQWLGVELSEHNHLQLFVPEGFAHGFCALSDMTGVLYKVSAFYAPQAEAGLCWNDPDLAITWPKLEGPYQVSPKDQQWPRLRDL